MEMGVDSGAATGIVWRWGEQWSEEQDLQIIAWAEEGRRLVDMSLLTGGARTAGAISGRLAFLAARGVTPLRDRGRPSADDRRAELTRRIEREARPWSPEEMAELRRLAGRVSRIELVIAGIRRRWPERSVGAVRTQLNNIGGLTGASIGQRAARRVAGDAPPPPPAAEAVRAGARIARVIAPLAGIQPVPFVSAMRGRDCHWVVEAPGLVGPHVCGAPLGAGNHNYCAAHAARARGTVPIVSQRKQEVGA